MKVSEIKIGETYKGLVVLRHEGHKGKTHYYLVKCAKCGKEYVIDKGSIGRTSMCRDCFNSRGSQINIAGQRFGKLIAIEPAGKRGNNYLWRCKCDCGKEHITTLSLLRNGNSKSCGCVYAECSRRGKLKTRIAASPDFEYKGTLNKHPLFFTWWGMKCRCENPNDKHYKDYGGRGIKICDRWSGLYGFENFVHDMGEKPSKKHSIDRIDVNGDYEPSNCRWATAKEQMNNLRNNLCFYCQGKRITAPQLSSKLGLNVSNISRKANKGIDINFIILNSNKYRVGKRQNYSGHINFNRELSEEVAKLLKPVNNSNGDKLE